MRDALIADLSALDDIEVVSTVDARLEAGSLASLSVRPISASDNPIEIWQSLIKTCDAALIVAPESDGVLSKLTQMVEASGVINLGCAQHSVDVASNKYDTFIRLKSVGIDTIPTIKAGEFLMLGFNEASSSSSGYVLKPIDGAGCEQMMIFKDQASARDWLRLAVHQHQHYIVQAFHTGVPASMSILCRDGLAWLLSCNQQEMGIEDTQHMKLLGIIVNGLSAYRADFKRLADRIAAAMPTLNGYVGVDVILNGNELIVVEINPRITSSYIALNESLGTNPMRMMLDLADAKKTTFTLPKKMLHHSVSLRFNA
ncbi:MAG: hypothetical protein RL063_956 [Pseudomonadota bacterium]